MDKIESLIKRMRRKICYSTYDDENKTSSSDSFQTKAKMSSHHTDLAPFEKDIVCRMNKLKFIKLSIKFF